MLEETYLALQPSESVVCAMASRLLAAHIASGQLSSDNEDEVIERCVRIAIKTAHLADRTIESDRENSED